MTICIISNYKIIIKGLKDLLSNNGFTIYTRQITYSKPAQIIREIKRISAQILILDFAFSKKPSEDLIVQLKNYDPDIKIVVLTQDHQNIYSIINSRANAHILASEISEQLVGAIEFISQEQAQACYYSPTIANMMASILHQSHLRRVDDVENDNYQKILTKRERQIFTMQAQNISNQIIASHFKISLSTVHTHSSNINRKLAHIQ